MEDNTDILIAVGCFVVLVGCVCFHMGRHDAYAERTYCAATLADGRKLSTTHLGPAGHSKCTYAVPQGSIAARRYKHG